MEIMDYDYEIDYDGDDGSQDEVEDYLETEHSADLISDNAHSSVPFKADQRTLEYDLRQAQKNADYYQHEIEKFTDNTTETYKNNCKSHLKKALEKVKDISEELEKLNSK